MEHHSAEKTYALFNSSASQKLISQLAGENENLLIFPHLSAEKVRPHEAGIQTLKKATEFDWIIFPDVWTVDFFLAFLRELEIDLYELDRTRICAFGEAVSDRLRFARIHADVIPTKLDDEAIFSALKEYQAGDFEGLQFLIPREISKPPPLAESLKKLKSVVAEIPVYRAFFEDERQNPKLKTLVKGGAVDEFIFSGAEDLIALKTLFPGENLSQILKEIKISALNEQAFQNLLENGLRPLYFHRK